VYALNASRQDAKSPREEVFAFLAWQGKQKAFGPKGRKTLRLCVFARENLMAKSAGQKSA